MDIFKLYRVFWNWCFENPSKIKPVHIAIYSFAIEHCNRLGWKKEFGLPTSMVMEAIGVRSYNTYIKAFRDLVDFGFIELIETSKNQYSSNIIALSNFNNAHNKALDKALIKHTTKQVQSTGESTSSIDIQYTNIQDTNIQGAKPKSKFNFRTSMLDYGFEEKLIDEWLTVRKKKKAVNSELAFNKFISQVEKSGMEINKLLEFIAVEKQWRSFNSDWLKNLNNNQNKNEETEQVTAKELREREIIRRATSLGMVDSEQASYA